MNILETLIVIFLIVSIVFTAVREPALTFKYGKELGITSWETIKWVYDTGKDIYIDVTERVSNGGINVTHEESR